MVAKPRPRPGVAGVAAAERALTVLTVFQSGDDALELAEIARRSGLVKSTIMRLAVSLERFGLMVRMSDGRYQLGGGVVRLNSIYHESQNIEQHILPILQQLTEETGETASFYVRHGAYRMCLYRVNSPHTLRVHIQPGTLRPMDESGAAQVLRMLENTPSTLPDGPLYTSGVTEPHAAAMAYPIVNRLGQSGALVLSAPSSRLTRERAEELRGVFMTAARTLISRLGGGQIGAGEAPVSGDAVSILVGDHVVRVGSSSRGG